MTKELVHVTAVKVLKKLEHRNYVDLMVVVHEFLSLHIAYRQFLLQLIISTSLSSWLI